MDSLQIAKNQLLFREAMKFIFVALLTKHKPA